jgi:hypothetical protein
MAATTMARRRPTRSELTASERRRLQQTMRQADEAERKAQVRAWERDRLIAELQDADITLAAIAAVVGETREMVRQRALRGRGPRPE